jgi:hypothetical protein
MATPWKPVRDIAPWLPQPPYLVEKQDLSRLRSALRDLGFKVFEADADRCTDERSLLAALGSALPFPDYYGANWAAFDDCIGDMLREEMGATAVIVVGADSLLKASLHAFVRAVHLLSDVVLDVERAGSGGFQLEIFFVGDFTHEVDGS